MTNNYREQVVQIEADRHAWSYADGYRNGYKILLGWLDLPEDHEWRVVPDPPAEDLVLPPPKSHNRRNLLKEMGRGRTL